MIRAKKATTKEKLIPQKVENRGFVPTLDEDGFFSFTLPENSNFKILQLTDVHIGNSLITRMQDRLAENAIIKLVEHVKPDLILFTGDNVYPMLPITLTRDNKKETLRFCKLVEKFEIPWAFVFGNHDTEVLSRCNKEQLSDIYQSQPHCLYKRGEKDIFGVGNYTIKVKNADGSLNNILFMLDSNMYGAGNFFTGFDVIHDDQIQWYEKQVEKYRDEKGNPPSSLAFFHMPLAEYKEAWNKLRFGSKDVEYKMGAVGESDNYMGISRKKGNFFQKAVDLGSTKGIFVGHDHLNTISMVYKGIQLTYGMSIDYLAYKGIRRNYSQRGGTIITLNPDSSFEVEHLPLSLLTTGTLGNDVIR